MNEAVDAAGENRLAVGRETDRGAAIRGMRFFEDQRGVLLAAEEPRSAVALDRADDLAVGRNRGGRHARVGVVPGEGHLVRVPLPNVNAGGVLGTFVAGDDQIAGPREGEVFDVGVGRGLSRRLPRARVDDVNRAIRSG